MCATPPAPHFTRFIAGETWDRSQVAPETVRRLVDTALAALDGAPEGAAAVIHIVIGEWDAYLWLARDASGTLFLSVTPDCPPPSLGEEWRAYVELLESSVIEMRRAEEAGLELRLRVARLDRRSAEALLSLTLHPGLPARGAREAGPGGRGTSEPGCGDRCEERLFDCLGLALLTGERRAIALQRGWEIACIIRGASECGGGSLLLRLGESGVEGVCLREAPEEAAEWLVEEGFTPLGREPSLSSS